MTIRIARRPVTSFFADWERAHAAELGAPTPRPRRCWGQRTRATAVAGLIVLGGGVGLVVVAASASADPSANTWYRLRVCESSDNYSIDTGNAHYGAYQFDLGTWHSVGGTGYPNRASKAEQDARALVLYRERGWQPWQCASILGLREDRDARSGRINDIHFPTSTSAGPSGVPAFPGGNHWFTYGESSASIKIFQDQMHARGYFPAGTGQYGPDTLRMVEQLQRLNGLVPNGYIGPNTWRLAWTGRYSAIPKSAPALAVAAFPGGTHWYHYGETNSNIKIFQDQMHARGYFPAGTGQYGPNTLRMVEQLQRLNGLVPNGYIGPNTWRLAWTGTYRAP
ncbi:MAG: peptidoglycan-binding protein [Actinomycetota bacterium]|nr:peptidoglycan-binding protein [Actinomycetota bacterium]